MDKTTAHAKLLARKAAGMQKGKADATEQIHLFSDHTKHILLKVINLLVLGQN